MGEREGPLTPITLKTQLQQASQLNMTETIVSLRTLVDGAMKIKKLNTKNFDQWNDDFRINLCDYPLGEAIVFGEIAPGHPQYSSSIDEKMGLVVLSCIEKDIDEPDNVALIISDIPKPCKGSTLLKALQAAHLETTGIRQKELENELGKLRYQGSARELKGRFNQIVIKLQRLGRHMTEQEKRFRVQELFVKTPALSNIYVIMEGAAHTYPNTESWFNGIAMEEAQRAVQARSLTAQESCSTTCVKIKRSMSCA